MKRNQIIHGNFLQNDLPDHCADIIIADPPYYQTKGEFDKIWESFEAYLKDVELWARECSRLLAFNGTLVWYGSWRNIAYSQIILDKYFHILNSCTIRKSNSIQAVLASPENQRTFFSNDERFLIYESNSEEVDENSGAMAKNVYIWKTGMLKQRVYRSLIDYMIGERDRAGYTAEQVNKALQTSMASHWFTRKSQWELPTTEQYAKLRDLFNSGKEGDYLRREYEDLRREYEDLRREYEDLRREYEDLRREYEDLRRPFRMEDRQSDVFDVIWDSGGSSRFEHPTVKDLRFTKNLLRYIIPTRGAEAGRYSFRRLRDGVSGMRSARTRLCRL